MPFSPELLDELDVLALYNLETTLEGIKVHHNADPGKINAVQRLYDKGLITQTDGGYLTDLGRETAEHVQALLRLLETA